MAVGAHAEQNEVKAWKTSRGGIKKPAKGLLVGLGCLLGDLLGFGVALNDLERRHRAELEALGFPLGDAVSRERVPDLFARADVLINNMEAGAPDKVVYEAAAACLPVLASNPVFDELFDGFPLSFDRESPESLAERLRWLASLDAGERAKIEVAVALAKEHGIRRATMLNVAGAYHSRLMETAYRKLGAALADVLRESHVVLGYAADPDPAATLAPLTRGVAGTARLQRARARLQRLAAPAAVQHDKGGEVLVLGLELVRGERRAWQRLVRVLGHEMNNSLAPIKSIAGSLLVEISLPKLLFAWTILLLLPAVLLGAAACRSAEDAATLRDFRGRSGIVARWHGPRAGGSIGRHTPPRSTSDPGFGRMA